MAQCRWCGQQSSHPQVCELCWRDLATGAIVRTLPPNPNAPTTPAPSAPMHAQPTQAVPPAPSAPVGSLPAQAFPPAPSAPISSQPTQAIPTPGQPQPLYDYSRPATQPVAQQPADGIRFISEVVEGYTFTAKLERFFGVALPLAALNVLVLGWKPEWSAWSNLLFFFLVGVWLPVSQLVDKLNDVELFRDMGIVLFLNFLCCNPLFAFVFYGLGLLLVWAVTRADVNWSLLGVMAIYVLLRILFGLVLILVDYEDLASWLNVGIAFFGSLPLLAMFLGWFIGGMFRPDY
ncbi:MAG: hypothetical protein NZ556_04340 [Fimbriimonadales bacterium]|nr:hypothetical protein [Fimbriimonadales bacterium]